MFPEIITERLALRDLEANDGPRVFSYHRHPEVARFQSWGTESVDVVQTYIRSLAGVEPGEPGQWYQVGIFLLDGGKLIGDCGFRVVESDPAQAEFGLTAELPIHRAEEASRVRLSRSAQCVVDSVAGAGGHAQGSAFREEPVVPGRVGGRRDLRPAGRRVVC
jgi:hypothetical protein